MKLKIACLLSVVLLTACADYTLLQTENKFDSGRTFATNYYSFDHPFTEKAEAQVAARAKYLCEQDKKVAVKTERACSLKTCNTNYQCMDSEKAKQFAP